MSEEQNDTRRRVLKKFGAASVLPFGSFAIDRSTRIPHFVNQNGVVKSEKVPRRWANHKDNIIQTKERLSSKLLSRPGIKEVGITAEPDKKIGDKRKLQIEVGKDPNRSQNDLPEEANGIRVAYENKEEAPVDLCYNGEFDNFPGGARLQDGNSGTVSLGTAGWKVNHNGSSKMLGAWHVFSDNQEVYGDTQDLSKAEQIGSVDHHDSDRDVCTISTDRDIDNIILGEDTTYDIGGWVHEDGVCSRASDWWDGYRNAGAITGETTGGIGKCHIDDDYNSQFPSYGGHGVRGSARGATGDSGAPSFSLHDGDAYLIYMVTQGEESRTPYNCIDASEYEKTLGTAAYELNDQGYSIQGSSRS